MDFQLFFVIRMLKNDIIKKYPSACMYFTTTMESGGMKLGTWKSFLFKHKYLHTCAS